MKKLLLIAVALCCATAIVVQAEEGGAKKEKPKLSDEQKQCMKDMVSKYDANKDGKLDKTEKEAMSQEDKDKMAKCFPAHGKGHDKKKKAE